MSESRRISSVNVCPGKSFALALVALLIATLGALTPLTAADAQPEGAPTFSAFWEVGAGASLNAAVTESGLQLRPAEGSAGPAGSWEIGLNLSSYGFAGALQTLGAASYSSGENRLVVQHDGLAIAYSNRPRGLAQAITLSKPQAGGSMEGLVSLELSVVGNLLVRRDPGRSEIAFVRPGGEIVLLLTLGRESGHPARFELLSGASANSYRLWIVLDASAGEAPEVELLIHRNTELEPNDVPAQANALSCGLEGGSLAAGEIDTFSVGAPVSGSRLFAAVETLRGGAGAFRLRLESSGVEAVSARDNQEARDSVLTQAASPVRAMTRVLGGGSAYLRIEAASTSAGADRYRLYAVVQPSINSATEETEPNDGSEKASRSSNDFYAAALATPKDVDHFAFTAASGDLVFIALDTDRNRDGQRFAGTLALLDASGAVLAFATEPSSHDVGIVYRTLIAGTYVVKVTGEFPLDAPERTDYALSISRNCQGSSFVPEPAAGGIGSIRKFSGTSGAPRTSASDPALDAYDPNGVKYEEDTLLAPPAEINNSVRVTKSGSVATISWTDSPGPYNVYKGSRPAVQAWAYNHSCYSTKLSTASTTDSALPSPGGLFYYLVTRQFSCEESIAGKDSSGVQIPDLGLCVPPGQGPPPSKPYFMVIVDNSGSMGTAIAGSTTCGYQSNRIGHARCAVRNMVNAFAGQVNFGLATYAWQEASCQNATCGTCDQTTGCFPQCTATFAPNDNNNCGPLIPEPTLSNLLVHAGAAVPVPLLQDHYWVDPPDPSNLSSLLSLVDNNCGNSEIGAFSNTPLGGSLFSMNKYFSGSFVNPFTGSTVPSPIGPATFNGQPAERTCRSINVILITDGDETCDSYNTGQYPNLEGLAVYEAGRLFNTGVTITGQNFRIKTYVIGFAGATTAALNNIAAAGGTTVSYTTANEAQLSTALGAIISGNQAPEKCDNLDNNCNGCVDEAYRHFRDVQPVAGNCCTWSNAVQRANCLNTYLASITPANPQGNRLLLPCTTAAQQQDSATWLCYDPGEMCDYVDNNGEGGVDEGQTKCGNPLHCPLTETCNGQDDNCNGQIDEGGVCTNGCVVTAEVCDGCDNDCDGIADDGVSVATPCGQPNPPNCAGTRTCKPAVPVPVGGCDPGGGYTACSNSPNPEVCDGIDNDCNGAVDDSGACPCSQRQELCNGADDNCNEQVDEGVTPPPVTQVCGVSAGATNPECTTQVGVTCVGGAWQCNFPAGVCGGPGGCGGTAEVCDALDNNCDGRLNENVPSFGKPCASDNGLPAPGHGLCRTAGTFICNGPSATVCSAVQADCATLPGGCDERCDGIDNDCDGLVDETFNSKGTNPTYFVKPAVTKIAAAQWIYSEEASRPSATSAFAGNGNGYFTSAPVGTTLDKTKSCSAPGKIPWSNVTGAEAEQICTAVGGHLCTSSEQQVACKTTPPGATVCTWGYAPNGSACVTVANANKYCNIGPSFDFNPSVSGDQDGLLVTASPQLLQCDADWIALLANGSANGRIYDMTGNLREMTKVTTNQYVLFGGAYNSASEAGSTCTFSFYNVNETYLALDTGFRCCFNSDPRQ